ncbi:condensation domain-containing protein [Streptomyces sp. NPDC031705]|uniref:condensation domain-containing protein n=1 Tax=Streptomyces sp. NPDC031705 TaxID=3155729 RepID=UPI003411B8EF
MSFPLLAEQYSMLYAQKLLGPGVAHNMTFTLPLPEGVDEARVAGAVAVFCEHQAALRAALRGSPPTVQWTGPDLPRPVVVESADVERTVRERLTALHLAELHPAGVPMRAAFELVRGPGRRAVLVVAMDHLVSDARSSVVAARQLAALVEGGPYGPGLPAPGDYADWCRRRAADGERSAARETAAWRSALDAVSPLHDPALDGAVGPAVLSQRDHVHDGADLDRAVRRLSTELGVSEFTTVSALLSLVLWQRTGQRDFVVHTPVSTRRRQQVDEVVGYFINERPLVCHIEEDRSLVEHAQDMYHSSLCAVRHSRLSVPELAEAVPAYRAALEGDQVGYVQLHVSRGTGELPGSGRPGPGASAPRTTELGAFRPGRPMTCTTVRFDFDPRQTLVRSFFGGPRSGAPSAGEIADGVVALLRRAAGAGHQPVAKLVA